MSRRTVFDWHVFMSTMMAGLLVAFVVGIVTFVRAADRRDERLKAVERRLDTLILSAHAHDSTTPVYLPDADPE